MRSSTRIANWSGRRQRGQRPLLDSATTPGRVGIANAVSQKAWCVIHVSHGINVRAVPNRSKIERVADKVHSAVVSSTVALVYRVDEVISDDKTWVAIPVRVTRYAACSELSKLDI